MTWKLDIFADGQHGGYLVDSGAFRAVVTMDKIFNIIYLIFSLLNL